MKLAIFTNHWTMDGLNLCLIKHLVDGLACLVHPN